MVLHVFLLSVLFKVPPKKPPVEQLTDQMWLAANHLNEMDPSFAGLVADCTRKIDIQLGSFAVVRLYLYYVHKRTLIAIVSYTDHDH